MNPLDVLRPNYTGNFFVNLGVDELMQNRGLGVKETQPVNLQAMSQRKESNDPEVMKDKIRTAKAKEFRRPKETIS